MRSAQIAEAFKWACLAELDAPKPGNVHVYAAGHRMTPEEFVRSAVAAAAPLSAPAARVGERILRAVEATLATVGANTNLGIILLCAPLAAAAEVTDEDLRAALAQVLRDLDRGDADLAFRAIVRAAPAGLGRSARHDVFAPATDSLLQAMIEAADRDGVARQYATNFADVFDVGLSNLDAMWDEADPRWATLATYLAFLSTFPDSHIVRKLGIPCAAEVKRKAASLHASLRMAEDKAQLLPDILAWDAALKSDGINPGTSADLTVATLFAHRLRTILRSLRIGG
ncbi:MAG: triphosphoribosyl-dephospho-CoA synthase [Bradyrhizobiaceae bacterium]|nr:triphosphoribosyl-dephospho-CoA synthase [Bradyrhizobiaceae bacterium]